MSGWLICAFVALTWFALGFVGAGWVYSDLQHRSAGYTFKPQHELRNADLRTASTLVCGGIVTLIAGYFLSGQGQYGWWRNWRPEEVN